MIVRSTFFWLAVFVCAAVWLVQPSEQQSGTSSCTGKATGDSCRTSLCMQDQTCNSQGQCSGGSAVDCAYIAAGYDACTFGLCDPLRGCVLAIHAAGTPCDTNNDYCDTELCSQTGDCIDYYTPVQCPQGQLCNPANGQCSVPVTPSVSPSRAPSSSSTPPPSVSAQPTPTPSLSVGETPSISPNPSPSFAGSITPTNFVHLSISPCPSGRHRNGTKSSTNVTSGTPSPSFYNSSLYNVTKKPNKNNGQNQTTAAEIAIEVVAAVCLACLCIVLFVSGVCVRKKHIKRIATRLHIRDIDWGCLRPIRNGDCGCLRRIRNGVQPYELQKTPSDIELCASASSQISLMRQQEARTLLDDEEPAPPTFGATSPAAAAAAAADASLSEMDRGIINALNHDDDDDAD